MSAHEPDDDPPGRLADAVEDALEPELRRSLAPLPDRPDQDRARRPKEREDEILEDLRERCHDE
ncbi:hypothetical protein [Actinomycetospora chibensis]|uniref:Uncharacterized protein n=1 Tax=Actinomycetospora chibensis TaxID=663606 RepID=A0ABV9RIG4_9PSEU|nr:hypothetical protein [Actinomycetospora chibensis]MDD7922458.1 hypothetical protein [Actinomycetospora chibensis]